MKKNLFFWMTLPIAVALYGQEQQDVEIKDGNPFQYMFMDFSGSHDLIPEKIPVFFQEIREQGLVNDISGDLFCIYFDFQAQVTGVDTVWGLGFKMSRDTTILPPLKKANYEYDKLARMIHVGPYEMVDLTYSKMIPYIEQKGMEVIGPPIETWLDEDPSQVDPANRRTEVIIPVRMIEH
jgi:effector-binding domain-containing protein